MSKPFERAKALEILKELVEFIEEKHLTDELCDDGDGYTDTWRSDELEHLINKAKETLDNLKTLPYPLKADLTTKKQQKI